MSTFQTWCKLLLFLLLRINVFTESAEICRKINSCSCQNSQGIIDLSPLSLNNGSAEFNNLGEGGFQSVKYSWNPCSKFSIGTTGCNDVAACMLNTATSQYQDLGTQHTAQFINDATAGLQLSYKSQTSNRILYIALNCDKTQEGSIVVIGEKPSGSMEYYMTLNSKYACPDNGVSNSGVSAGTIIAILISSGVILYIFGGMVFQKAVRGASGAEIIPNYHFWSSVLGSAHTGCLYVFQCGRNRQKLYSEI